MTVEYNKGTACPILLSTKESAVALTMDSAKKLQADLAKIIEQAEKEPEMSEMETSLLSWLSDDTSGEIPMERMKHIVKARAAELLDIAKQQLLRSGELLTQEHHEKLMETLREECKKDLPRWRNVEADKKYVGCVTRYMDVNGDWNYCMSSGKLSDDCQYISIAALEKLPKEDEK